MIGQFTGITFVKVTETATQCGDIRIGVTSSSYLDGDDGAAGIAQVSTDFGQYKSSFSDVWINDNYVSDFSTGSFGLYNLMHEIGHAMGLKHPHDSFNGGAGWVSPSMSTTFDHLGYTLMAYRDYPGDDYQGEGEIHSVKDINGDDIYNYTYMYYDLYALRWLYSYNAQTSSFVTPDVTDDESYGFGDTGNNTYTISGTNITGSFTIFDTGGTDTLDFSGQSVDSTINLDETLSEIGDTAGDYIINYDSGEYFSGLIVSIYYANSIENVNAGSGDDIITCNSATNVINCGSGIDTVYSIGAGDTVNGDAGYDNFSITSYSVTLIDGGSGIDDLYLSGTGTYDLRSFSDASLTSIEFIDIQWGTATTLIISKESILDLESTYTWDLDADGDNDYVVYILADSLLDEIEAYGGWTYGGWDTDFGVDWQYYYIDSLNTWFAVTYGTTVDLNPTSRISSNTLPDEDTPTNPDEDDTPVFPNDDTPPDIDLPDWNLFVAGLDLDSITLPETVVVMEDGVAPDLSALIGLIGDQGESLEFDFDQVDTDSPIVASIESVKPVIVDWISQTDPIIDSDWTPIIEELFYTTELG